MDMFAFGETEAKRVTLLAGLGGMGKLRAAPRAARLVGVPLSHSPQAP